MVKLEDLQFPVSYVQLIQEIYATKGLDPQRFLLEKFAITPELLASPVGKISGIKFNALLELIGEFAGESLENQRKLIDFFPPTIHGYVALAAITSATVKNALDIAVRFAHQVMPAYEMRYSVSEGQCQFYFVRLTDFGACNDLMTELVFCAMHSFMRMFSHDSPELHLTLSHDKLVMSELAQMYPNLTIQTGSKENSIRFSDVHLNQVIATRNTATYQAIEQALENNEAQLRLRHSLAHRVSSEILSMLKRQQTVEAEAIAHALSLSSRTLSRRLSEEGTSLRQLYNDCRSGIAKDLLTQEKMTIGQISLQLGFTDEANFSRFFKQQTGQSPTAFRASCKH
jgi:AraC-like DNA-binding protein